MIYSQDLFSFSIKCYPKIKKLPKNQEAFAERARFELAVEFNPYGGLANRWFQPLTHLSKLKNLQGKDNT